MAVTKNLTHICCSLRTHCCARTSRYYSGSARLAVVGSGPAGFYTTQALLKQSKCIEVDIIEKLPVPFGLVRYGVAPDHQNVKNVINKFTSVAEHPRCRFVGNIEVGVDISVTELKQFYNGVVYAYGAQSSKRLGIPGESTLGVYPADAFVGWYNGHPDYKNLTLDLSSETCVIIGHGNVALDCARMILTPVELIQRTDMSQHAIDALKQSNIRRVIMVGRDGPLQACFTTRELREMTRIPQCSPVLNPQDFEQYQSNFSGVSRAQRRLLELFIRISSLKRLHNEDKTWELLFMHSPVEILTSNSGVARAVKLEINKQNDRSVLYKEIASSLIITSIGFRSIPIDPSIPTEPSTGIILNSRGRVVDTDGKVCPGFYCTGWARRGAVGAFSSNLHDPYETANCIVEDIKTGSLPKERCKEDFVEYLKNSGVRPTLFKDWQKIDCQEKQRGRYQGKPKGKKLL